MVFRGGFHPTPLGVVFPLVTRGGFHPSPLGGKGVMTSLPDTSIRQLLPQHRPSLVSTCVSLGRTYSIFFFISLTSQPMERSEKKLQMPGIEPGSFGRQPDDITTRPTAVLIYVF